jgi:radical SAM superfamily enzyme YgiQ (UPF0313 family)
VSVLLLSTYDLGRQPVGLASPAAWLRRAGFAVATCDLSRDRLDENAVRSASTIAIYLPMHTATRLSIPVIQRIRSLNPEASIAAYGLYAPLSESLLREHGVRHVLGPDAEADLVELAAGRTPRPTGRVSGSPAARLPMIVPDRSSLPGLGRYATLLMPDGSARVAGSTDATRGCKHRCRHCPIVPVYDGHFRAVPIDVVLADVEQQIQAGAEHITFGDPDFFNGPTHARRIVEQVHARHPQVSYDVTIKVEHLLKHRELLPVLVRTGCLFVTSAVESLDDEVLAKLEKGHTRADFFEIVSLCRETGLLLVPTFVAFTPWTTSEGFADLLESVAALDLVEHVAPVQWGLRLLVTEGSRLLELNEIRGCVSAFDPRSLTYPWRHADPGVDALQAAIMTLVGTRLTRPRRELFDAVRALAGLEPWRPVLASRSVIPYLNEPWFC